MGGLDEAIKREYSQRFPLDYVPKNLIGEAEKIAKLCAKLTMGVDDISKTENIHKIILNSKAMMEDFCAASPTVTYYH